MIGPRSHPLLEDILYNWGAVSSSESSLVFEKKEGFEFPERALRLMLKSKHTVGATVHRVTDFCAAIKLSRGLPPASLPLQGRDHIIPLRFLGLSGACHVIRAEEMCISGLIHLHRNGFLLFCPN